MASDGDYELELSNPWGIQFSLDDNRVLYDSIDDVTAQTAQLALSEQPKSTVSWSDHEKLTGQILNEAAQRAAAETFKNICVYHPTQSHKPSKDTPGDGIRPDYIIAWSCDGIRKSTAVVDAKDYHGQVPRKEYEKICRDMRETKATRGILVLGSDASISDKLRADIEKDNKVDIVHVKNNQADVVREVTQHIGKIIQKDFVPDDKRYETYQSFVKSTDNAQERKPNRYGENNTYTCNSTYHRFEHPRKQDGTIDERYEANQDRNKDGGPDMRVAHNKTNEAQEQHLNEDGSEDMRNKEHREQLVDETGHRLNADGSPDMRCQENKTDEPTNTSSDGNSSQTNENTDMRLKENRENMVDGEGHQLNADGSPDMRCQENKTDEPTNTPSDDQTAENTDMRLAENRENMVDGEGHQLNADGTRDMRYQENKTDELTNTSSDGNSSQTNENTDMRLEENRENMVDDEGHHLNADGTRDMRCQENQEETNATIPTKGDGTADMRYTASKDAVAEGIIEPDEKLTGGTDTVSTSNDEGFSEESTTADIPTKSDGTADMRFSASQEAVASGEIAPDEVLGGSDENLAGGNMESSSGMMDGGESGDGPLKADGTPDMRYSVNQ